MERIYLVHIVVFGLSYLNSTHFLDWSFAMLAWWFVSLKIYWGHGCRRVYSPCSSCEASEGLYSMFCMSYCKMLAVHINYELVAQSTLLFLLTWRICAFFQNFELIKRSQLDLIPEHLMILTAAFHWRWSDHHLKRRCMGCLKCRKSSWLLPRDAAWCCSKADS